MADTRLYGSRTRPAAAGQNRRLRECSTAPARRSVAAPSITAAPKKRGSATITLGLSDGKVTVPVVITVLVGTDKSETLNGTTGTDMVFGLSGQNIINGNAGNDLLCGRNSNDTINGGDGNDIIDGENGDDAISGGDGNDILRGSSGDDTLTGGAGADLFSGGSGVDTATDFNPTQGDTQDGTIP